MVGEEGLIVSLDDGTDFTLDALMGEDDGVT